MFLAPRITLTEQYYEKSRLIRVFMRLTQNFLACLCALVVPVQEMFFNIGTEFFDDIREHIGSDHQTQFLTAGWP